MCRHDNLEISISTHPGEDSITSLWGLELPLLMSNSGPLRCISCLHPWSVVSRARTTRKTKTGPKGNLLPRCEECHWEKYRRTNYPYPKTDLLPRPSKLITFVAFKEEMRLLGQRPDWRQFDAAISDLWKGDSEEIRSVCSQISDLIHEHTGYKFIPQHAKGYIKGALQVRVCLSCKQRETCRRPVRNPNQEISKTDNRYPIQEFPCEGKGTIIFTHQSRQVFVQLSHQTGHPPYMQTNIPGKWVKFIIKRYDWYFSDLLWKAIVEENERNGNGPLLFTERMVGQFLAKFFINRKGKDKVALDHLLELCVRSDNDPDYNSPCPPPAFIGEGYDDMDLGTWVHDGDYLPSLPVNDGNDGEDERPEDEDPIIDEVSEVKVKVTNEQS
ncbi:hypothetical protein CPB86DRAFT_826498 [Serendipita vermifera]|nr:hypothetical protein CPB86DRAFT_826498 [Serendipita vermifera]